MQFSVAAYAKGVMLKYARRTFYGLTMFCPLIIVLYSIGSTLAYKNLIIDHNNEETVKSVLEQGFYAGFTIYPFTKMGNERMVEIVKQYGSERIMVNSAADWGISDPLAVPKTAALMKIRGISDEDIKLVTYQNAITAFAQSGQINVEDFEMVKEIDRSLKFNGNTILRGGQQPRINKNSIFIN